VIKNLNIFGVDLKNIIILDNTPSVF